jgi:hypothetical protein
MGEALKIEKSTHTALDHHAHGFVPNAVHVIDAASDGHVGVSGVEAT